MTIQEYIENQNYGSDINPLDSSTKLVYEAVMLDLGESDFGENVIPLQVETKESAVDIFHKLEENQNVLYYSMVVCGNGVRLKLYIDNEDIKQAIELIQNQTGAYELLTK